MSPNRPSARPFKDPRRPTGLLVGLAAVLAFGFPFLTSVPGPVSAVAPHPPILIVGDAEFIPANGVTGGSGTSADPYVIDGWDIDASTAHGIKIQNTRAHFVVRDSSVHSGRTGGFTGIVLENATDGSVHNLDVSNNSVGIVIQTSSRIAVTNNTVSSNVNPGIWIALDASDITVAWNAVFDNGTPGGLVAYGDRLVISGNDIHDNVDNVLIDMVTDVTFEGNRVWGSSTTALTLDRSARVRVFANTFQNAFNRNIIRASSDVLFVNNVVDSLPLDVSASSNVTAYHNSFLAPPSCARDTSAVGNNWDSGYPGGGNYYAEFVCWSPIIPDNCSGPLQDACLDPDGIADIPYILDSGAGTQDDYPLKTPCAPNCAAPPPTMLAARLEGGGLADVGLTWIPSPADGGLADDVAGYEVWHGTAYSPTASGYTLLASLPRGSTAFVHTNMGAGNSTDHFYLVRSIDASGRTRDAWEQAGKHAQFLATGTRLVSVPFELFAWDAEAMFRTVSWSVARAFDSDGGGAWVMWEFGAPSGGITADRGMGVWAQIDADAWWVTAGIVPATTKLTLRSGWNLIGYPSFVPRTVSQTFSGVTFGTVEGWANVSPYYLQTLSGTTTMVPGEGYWVYVSGPAATVLLTN